MSPSIVDLALAGALGAAQTIGLETPAGAKAFLFEEPAVYAVIATPGRITDIVLEPGEVLVGALAAGDTARWVIGDTFSGAGETRRVHVMIKPTLPELATNLIINTDRRSYHLELRASARTWHSQVSWRYPPLAVASPVAAPNVEPKPSAVVARRIHSAYRIEGDRPAWRPISVHDDGLRTYIAFGAGARLDALPPLFVLGADGKTAELVNYHVDGRRIVVERLFDRAELRLGIKKNAQRVRLVRLPSVEVVQ